MSRRTLFCLGLLLPLAGGQLAWGQANNGNNGNNGDNGNAGITIDARGVITPKFSRANEAALAKQRKEAASGLSADLNQPSLLRKVSLTRLEQALREKLERQEDIPLEMRYLAGVQRIDYIFVYPDSKEIVIAGPAEGFAPDELGRVTGLTSHRPALRLDDFLVALRTVRDGNVLGCSIDPEPQRLANLEQYVRNLTPTTPAAAQARYREMAGILGLQNVTVQGVSAETLLAQTLVEADLRMKLVSMGIENPKVKGFRSHLSMLVPNGNSMQRWWLMPYYDSIGSIEDGTAFQLNGQRVQMLAQEEIARNGQRSDAPFTRVTTEKYAQHFNEKFPELAAAVPVFADLQNVIDMAVLAALIEKERLAQKVQWDMALYLDEGQLPTIRAQVPRQVQSSFNSRMAGGRMVIGLVGGGVTINPRNTLRNVSFQTDEGGRLAGIRRGSVAPAERTAKHPWWWD